MALPPGTEGEGTVEATGVAESAGEAEAVESDGAEAGGPGFGLGASHILHELGFAAPALTNEQTPHAHSQFTTGDRSATDKAMACANMVSSSAPRADASSSGSAEMSDAGAAGLGESHVAQRTCCSIGFSMVQNVHVHVDVDVDGAETGDAEEVRAVEAVKVAEVDAARDAPDAEADDDGGGSAAEAATSAEANAKEANDMF